MRYFSNTALLVILILSALGCEKNKQSIHAGVAVVDITPPLELQPILGGYGDRMSKPAEGVHDRIFAKALVLKDQENSFALITADIQSFPPYFKAQLVEALAEEGWDGNEIMLLPSHSHTSIEMMSIHIKNNLNIPQIGIFNKDVLVLTIENLKKAVLNAQANMQPVKVGTIRKELVGWNRNRREGNLTIDPDLTITRFDLLNNQPLALLVNWTAHPTFMGSEDMDFSGGWPGHLQRTMEALFDSQVTVFYYNGAEGDQRPISQLEYGSNWEQAESYGRELGILSWKLAQNIQTKPVYEVHRYITSISLPELTWHPEFMQTGGAEYGLNEETAAYVINLLFPRTTSSTAINIGDLMIIGIPGELTAELGQEIKRKVLDQTDIHYVTIGGLADEWISYMLSKEEYEKGGYEASVSFYGPTLGPLVVDRIVDAATSFQLQYLAKN